MVKIRDQGTVTNKSAYLAVARKRRPLQRPVRQRHVQFSARLLNAHRIRSAHSFQIGVQGRGTTRGVGH